MPQAKNAPSTEIIADDFTPAQIADRRDRALQHLGAAGSFWPGLVRLPSGERTGNLGKLVARLSGPLHHLFDALTPRSEDDAETKKHKAELASIFDKMLGAQDRGKDDRRFEVELLLRRLDRIEAQQQIIEELDRLRARFADDALNTGEMVIAPGIQALEVARTAAASNPAFRSLLAPTLDALGEMTKKARRHQDAARKGGKDKTGEPDGDGHPEDA
ncbi:MAG: hypothetical protein QM820_08745 [Minicystis sp.]